MNWTKKSRPKYKERANKENTKKGPFWNAWTTTTTKNVVEDFFSMTKWVFSEWVFVFQFLPCIQKYNRKWKTEEKNVKVKLQNFARFKTWKQKTSLSQKLWVLFFLSIFSLHIILCELYSLKVLFAFFRSIFDTYFFSLFGKFSSLLTFPSKIELAFAKQT